MATPNVLLILTDDQGYGDLSFHGNPILKTPALDQLAKQSVRLDRFYVNAVCAPTRASLLTGRYHLRTGAFGVTRRQEVMNPEEVTLAELFQTNGYATGCFGKWHNGNIFPETPNGQGFQEFLGILGGLSQLYFDPILNHNGVDKEFHGYITELLADAAMTWMEEQVQSEKPFFCYIPFNAPHTPGLVEERYWKPYFDRGVGRWEAVIYGMIEVIDAQVARLLKFLEDQAQEENTIVIFLSDNGPATWRYNAGLRGKKARLHDGGTRVPCFIRWPGTLAPARIEYPLAHIDLLPTLADWCGLTGHEILQLDGKSFAPLAVNPQTQWQDRKLISFAHRSEENIRKTAAVHTHQWAAVMERGKWELFDIVNDVRQRDNVAPRHPEIILELKTAFENTLDTMPPFGTVTPHPLRNRGPQSVRLEGQNAILPPRLKGKGIDYNYPAGISHQWISFWTDTDATPEWPVKVIDPGQFEVFLRYCISEEDLGVQAMFEIQGQSLAINITEAFDPAPNPQPFLLDGESVKYENKPWKTLPLGRINLTKGHTTARLRATQIPGNQAMEVKEIVLRRL